MFILRTSITKLGDIRDRHYLVFGFFPIEIKKGKCGADGYPFIEGCFIVKYFLMNGTKK